jgi:hypothetical protein
MKDTPPPPSLQWPSAQLAYLTQDGGFWVLPTFRHYWDLIGDFLTDSLGIKAAGVLSRMCSVMTDLQLASSTPASASSLSRVSPSQLVQHTDYQLIETLV